MVEMKMKEPPKVATPTAALTTAADRAAIEEMFKTQEGGGFLPKFKIVWGIETPLVKYAGKAIIKSQDDIIEMLKPYRIGAIKPRHAVKYEFKKPGEDEGSVEMSYEGGTTHAKYVEAKAKADAGAAGYTKGLETLVVIFVDDKAILATAPGFKVMQEYLAKPFGQALIAVHQTVVRVDCIDHLKNLTKSKTSGKYYYAPWKFTQWEQEEVTKQQSALFAGVMTEKQKLVDNWLKR